MTKTEALRRIRALERDRALLRCMTALPLMKEEKAVIRSALRWNRGPMPEIAENAGLMNAERWLARDCIRLLRAREKK